MASKIFAEKKGISSACKTDLSLKIWILSCFWKINNNSTGLLFFMTQLAGIDQQLSCLRTPLLVTGALPLGFLPGYCCCGMIPPTEGTPSHVDWNKSLGFGYNHTFLCPKTLSKYIFYIPLVKSTFSVKLIPKLLFLVYHKTFRYTSLVVKCLLCNIIGNTLNF